MSEEIKNLPVIFGHGGGPGAPPAPTEEDDSVYSKQTVKVMFAISEGEIPLDVEQGDLSSEIFLNDLKLKTFKKCSYYLREGSSGQTVIPGFEEVESPLQLQAQELRQDNAPATTQLAIPPNMTAVRCIVTFDSSYFQDRDGNKKRTTTELHFSASPTDDENSTFTVQKRLYVEEKSSGPFSVQCRVERPAGHVAGTYWRVKARRISKDRGEYTEPFPGVDGYLVNKTTWTQAVGLSHFDTPKTYPNTALLALVLKNAIRLGGTMPDVIFRVKGVKVKIPNNYDPVNRTYTGTWSGLWKTDGLGNIQKHYTPNPAWCIYDILTRTKRQGGLAIPETDINRFSFYYLSQICDQTLQTEYNNQYYTTRRYELHNCFDVREPAKNILTYMLAICDSIFGTDEFGLLTIIPDAPQSVSEVVTNADVIDGVFEYTSNDLEDRVSYVNVTYNNPDDRGRTATVTVPDDTPLPEEVEIEDRYGYRGADVVLVGCASKAQAIRKGRWYLYSNSVTTGFVSFKTFMRGISLRLGKVINILDSDNQNVKQQGRIISAAPIVRMGVTYLGLQFDREVEHETGQGKPDLDKVCYYSIADGYVEVSGFVDWAISPSLMYVPANSPHPIIGSIFALFGHIDPTTWRISAIELDSETQIHTITCTQYAVEKYNYIDNNVFLKPPPPIDIDDLETPPVYNVSVYKEYYTDSLGSHSNLVLLWQWPDPNRINPPDWVIQPYDASYQVIWQRDESIATTVDNISRTEFRIENAVPGFYSGKIYAYNPKLMRSDPVSWYFDYNSRGISDLLPPLYLQTEDYAKGFTTNPGEFLQQDCVLLFYYNPVNDKLPTAGLPVGQEPDKLFDYLIEVWTDNIKYNTYLCSPFNGVTTIPDGAYPGLRGGRFVFDITKNTETFKRSWPYTARRSFLLRVYSRDYRGDISAYPSDIVVGNFAPVAVPVVEIIRTYSHVRIRLDWSAVPIPIDLQYYLITMSSSAVADSAAAQNQLVIYRGPSREISVPLPDNGPAFFHAAGVDRFGEINLTFNINNTISGYLNGLLETVGSWELDTVSVADDAPNGVFGRDLIAGTIDIPYVSPAYVTAKVACNFSCPLQLKKVRLGINNGSDWYWKEVFSRSGNDLGARYFSGTAVFSDIPVMNYTSTFTAKAEVKHMYGDTVNFRDVLLTAEIRLK